MPPREKTADAVGFMLRLPRSLHKRLQKQAEQNNVSLNTQLVNMLEGYEAATIKRVTEITQPILDEAVKQAAQMAGTATIDVLLQGPVNLSEESKEALEALRERFKKAAD
jgi:HicB family